MDYKLALVFLPAFFQLCTAIQFSCQNQARFPHPTCITDQNGKKYASYAEPDNNGLSECPSYPAYCCGWKAKGLEPVDPAKLHQLCSAING
ncbi:hypothetical protein O181_079925 [Austropuccinia psidii MF-1]|uniref:Uncharacterized protein n=1 Tax=Austropuccinia psidii MF-1 TaxID=1389203 RepID=A0A9Q3FFX3_9BASI|nr:hypothetical protein [Austropuccinia psidii MF-1]